MEAWAAWMAGRTDKLERLVGSQAAEALNAQQGCVYLTQFGMGSHSRSLGSDVTRSKSCLVNSNEAVPVQFQLLS